MDWLRASAAAQGRAIMAGLLDPVDQTEAYLAAIEANPYAGRIYARVTPARAKVEAREQAREQARYDREQAAPRRRTRETPVEAMTKSVLRTAGSTLTRELLRGVLGSLRRR